MSNNYFNIKIPSFNEEYGSDWDDFKTEIDLSVDNIMNKTFQLYWLNDPNYFTTRVAEIVLKSLDISFDSTDTLLNKKLKIRTFLSQYANKGLEDIYLDIGEDIVGTRGVVYTTLSTLNWIWATSRWGSSGNTSTDSIKWVSNSFFVYIDVKTVDSVKLDEIQLMFQQDSLLPAFYKIYLIDSSFNVLRTI